MAIVPIVLNPAVLKSISEYQDELNKAREVAQKNPTDENLDRYNDANLALAVAKAEAPNPRLKRKYR